MVMRVMVMMRVCYLSLLVWSDSAACGLLHGSPEHRQDPGTEGGVAQRLQRGESPPLPPPSPPFLPSLASSSTGSHVTCLVLCVSDLCVCVCV